MIVEITPIALTNIKYKFYVILAIFNICIAAIVFFFFPETNQMSLEEIDFYFAEKHGGTGKDKESNVQQVEEVSSKV
jgi:hypothetical protein